MQEIASFTFAYEAFPEAVGMLWKRLLQDNKQNWRRVYKSLLLLDYLLKNGSERVVTSAREHIYDLRGRYVVVTDKVSSVKTNFILSRLIYYTLWCVTAGNSPIF